MTERILLSALIFTTAVIIFQLLNWWTLRRARRYGSADPLLSDFQPGSPAILFFTADHCAACHLQQKPILAQLTDEIQIIQVDADQHPEDAKRWGVMSLPTTVILDDSGAPRSMNHGVASSQTLLKQLDMLKRIETP